MRKKRNHKKNLDLGENIDVGYLKKYCMRMWNEFL
jgi:hypothetical protein